MNLPDQNAPPKGALSEEKAAAQAVPPSPALNWQIHENVRCRADCLDDDVPPCSTGPRHDQR
jgi:hypothetical protein